MDLTLFEVHLDDASLTANAPFSGEESEPVDQTETEDQGGVPTVVPFVVVLAVLAGLAYLVRKWRSGDEPAEIEPETPGPEPDVATT